MKRLIRRLSRVADSSQCTPPREAKEEGGGGGGGRRRKVPEGYVPVYVGEEMKRFEVRAELLGRPAFVELLRRSAQEYGYDQRGVLRIPCPVPLFRQVLYFLASGADAGGDLAVEELFRSLPEEIPSGSPSSGEAPVSHFALSNDPCPYNAV
ncbi:auxin-responsive protein SAUR71 [Elaeis guineensis]|uniref:Auxin-responsive protein SAUR71 n=1 Tax=Elaeis guineensis var. tenera TaxID=51953 RepID=A0A6I9SDQ7_ELAGV|nr:auxin-responsive protein SAUR71 [Elaeis guineensis]